MNRTEKTNYINSLKKELESNNAMMVYHYEGLNVNQLDELRDKMREAGALLKVTKNRITKLALKETTHSEAENLFSGPTGIALSKDPITLAKILVKFQKTNDKLKIVGGIMDKKLLAPTDVAEIAKLPTLDEARAKIVGILQAPQQKLISILLAPGRKIANLAHAKSLKKINLKGLKNMADLNKIVDELSTLSVVEAAELSKLLEEKWGVTAAAPVAAAAPAAGGGEAAEEKDEFSVVLAASGDNKIGVIKEVRAFTGLGLKEAKDLVEGAPKELKTGVSKKDAEEVKKKFEAAGAKVELK